MSRGSKEQEAKLGFFYQIFYFTTLFFMIMRKKIVLHNPYPDFQVCFP